MSAFRTAAGEVTEAELPAVEVLGIGETRRGRPRWEQDPATGKRQLTRDRWHTGFVDALGTSVAGGTTWFNGTQYPGHGPGAELPA